MLEIHLFLRKPEMKQSTFPIPQGVHLTALLITAQAISISPIFRVTSSESIIQTALLWLSILMILGVN